MRVVVAPDKFKTSLTASQVADHLAAGLRESAPEAELDLVPVADGGEGTLDAAVACGFTHVGTEVSGPLQTPVTAGFGLADGAATEFGGDRIAVVELALASGLAAVPRWATQPQLDALAASSHGTGELIRAALDAGADTIVLAIGGSACTDGGAGMITALGARLLDADGSQLPPGGGFLTALHRVDLSGLDTRIRSTNFVLASDVTNPLLGEDGAATVFGPQKGAARDQLPVLEAGLRQLRDCFFAELGESAVRIAQAEGAGAAGGVGYAAQLVLGADTRPGIDVVLGLCGFAERLPGSDLVITGEGSFDAQSLQGKAPVGVARLAKAHGINCIVVCGRTDLAPDQTSDVGRVYPLTDLLPDPVACMTQAGPLLRRLGAQIGAQFTTRRTAVSNDSVRNE